MAVEMVIQHEGMRIIQVVVQYVSKYMDLGFKYYRKNKAKYITKTPKSTEITLIHKKKNVMKLTWLNYCWAIIKGGSSLSFLGLKPVVRGCLSLFSYYNCQQSAIKWRTIFHVMPYFEIKSVNKVLLDHKYQPHKHNAEFWAWFHHHLWLQGTQILVQPALCDWMQKTNQWMLQYQENSWPNKSKKRLTTCMP